MSSKILLSFLGGCLALFLVIGISVNNSDAQVVSGKTAEPSGQLVVPFDNRGDRGTFVQVTNTNPDLPVNIHVQIMNGASPTCAECDFFDTLTPLDTVVYELESLESNEVIPTGVRGFLPCSTSSYGVMVVTPTEGANPDQSGAIAHNYLHGVVNIYNNDGSEGSTGYWDYLFNAIGRDAVLPGGTQAPDGTAVDGVAASFASIQPNSYNIHYAGTDSSGYLGDLVGVPGFPLLTDAYFVAMQDDYSGGSYSPQPGNSDTYTIDIFDEAENFQSCDEISFTCIDLYGVNILHDTTPFEDDLLDCSTDAGHIPDEGCLHICENPTAAHETGYTRLRSLGGGDADANFGVLGIAVTDAGGASHIFVK